MKFEDPGASLTRQKLVRADNTIIKFLTPEELETLSEAEQAARRTPLRNAV